MKKTQPIIQVRNSKFILDGDPYYFLGTNFWYGPHLGSSGKNGNPKRLIRELEHLKELGINTFM